MNSHRSEAYGRVVRTIDHLGPAKLQLAEQDVIRTAADALFFDGDAREELAVIEELAQKLVESERWTSERAQQLIDDVAACGPPVGVR